MIFILDIYYFVVFCYIMSWWTPICLTFTNNDSPSNKRWLSVRGCLVNFWFHGSQSTMTTPWLYLNNELIGLYNIYIYLYIYIYINKHTYIIQLNGASTCLLCIPFFLNDLMNRSESCRLVWWWGAWHGMASKFERDQLLTAVESADKSKRNDSGEVKKEMNTKYIKTWVFP